MRKSEQVGDKVSNSVEKSIGPKINTNNRTTNNSYDSVKNSTINNHLGDLFEEVPQDSILNYASKNAAIVFDGAMGTNLQVTLKKLKKESNNELSIESELGEYFNITNPSIIEDIHYEFLMAGAEVLKTNSFNANHIVLSEYNLHHKIEEINTQAVQIARNAILRYQRDTNQMRPVWIAGSVGPANKMPSFKHIEFEEYATAFRTQIKSLILAGVDIINLETAQDLWATKIMLIAVQDVLNEIKNEMKATCAEKVATNRLPLLTKMPLIMTSFTMQSSGTILSGASIETILATIQDFNPDIIGINCGTGPRAMYTYAQYLVKNFKGLVSVLPNAGIPQVINGETVYNEDPASFASTLAEIVTTLGVNIVGGCCGTTPAHIQALKEKISTLKKSSSKINKEIDKNEFISKQVTSPYNVFSLKQNPPPFIIGERANVTGSKVFRELLLNNKFPEMVELAESQVKEGAHVIDLSLSYVGRDEKQDMIRFLQAGLGKITLPITIDSTNPEIVEAALMHIPGRSIINSINLEDGGKNLHAICKLAQRFKASVVALTIDEEGMAQTVEHKLSVLERIRKIAKESYGLEDGDILYDLLTFTVGSGKDVDRDLAKNTLEAISIAKKRYPNILTVLGVSNVSYGLSANIRPYLNTIFLHLALEKGLDAAIVHSGKILPYHQIPEEVRNLGTNLLLNNPVEGKDPLLSFLAYFKKENIKSGNAPNNLNGRNNLSGQSNTQNVSSANEQEKDGRYRLIECVKNGERLNLYSIIDELLASKKYSPADIISRILLKAMDEVGVLFASGDMQLPFVLQSAEIMKLSVDYLKPKMGNKELISRGKFLLGTVEGDIHDIGKNLVNIILSNNGYEVIDLGVKISAGRFIEAILHHKVDAVGMSGLLVQSVHRMLENIKLMNSHGIKIPVFLGGAALTKDFVKNSCQPHYAGEVFYCADAFSALEGLSACQCLI